MMTYIDSISDYEQLYHSSIVDRCAAGLLRGIWQLRAQNETAREQGVWVIAFGTEELIRRYLKRDIVAECTLRGGWEPRRRLQRNEFSLEVMVGTETHTYFSRDRVFTDRELEDQWTDTYSSVSDRLEDNNRQREVCKATTGKCAWCKTELQSLRRCTGCLVVAYCNESCQRAHWKHEHKKDCSHFRPAEVHGHAFDHLRRRRNL